MANIRDVKKKIHGVKNTQQITRAMKMVATAKLRQSIERLRASSFYLEKLEQIVADLQGVVGAVHHHPLVAPRKEVKTIGVVVVTGSRGLCGSFNSDLIKNAVRFFKEHPSPSEKIITIGKRGEEFFRRHGREIFAAYPNLSEQYNINDVKRVSATVIDGYLKEDFDDLFIVYTHYVNALQRQVRIKRLLPIQEMTGDKSTRLTGRTDMIFEPSPQVILEALIPKYVEGMFSRAVIESSAAEQSARMIAMGAATDRADEMIDQMTLIYNRTRQAIITKELSEVVAGADALSE